MKATRFAVPLSAIASSVALMLWSVPAQAANPPPEVTMSQLNQRVEKVQQLTGLKDGDTVVITDNGAITGANFKGTFIYHPAGSLVSMNDMYVRWKDGLVTVRHSTNETKKNQMLATFIQQYNYLRSRGELNSDPGILNPYLQKQVTQVVSGDPVDWSILRIPENAWLFHDNENGTFTTLVDAFEFKMGDTPTAASMPDGTIPLGKGNITQPVPVMFQR